MLRTLRKTAAAAHSRSHRRGAALMFSMLVLMVLTIVGMGMTSAMLQSLYLVRIQKNSSHAFNIAESGAEAALLWLRTQSSPPSGSASFDPFSGAVTLSPGNYRITIDPDDNNDTLDFKRYLVRSRGFAYNRQETVEIYVQLGNFGRFAYFTDYERSSVSNGAIYFKAGEVIDGPAHSNNSEDTIFNINYVGSTASIFKDRLTAVDTDINYVPGRPTNESDFRKVYEDGSRGFQTGVNRIELPDSTDKQKIAAWGGSTGFPTASTGVYVPTSGSTTIGGIYIRGDSTMTFADTTEGWQRITIVQGSTTTTITVKRDTNQTVVQKTGQSTVTYVGTMNGAIYTTGHITSLSGTLADNRVSGETITSRNAYTIATDMLNGKNVTITNHLKYKTTPDKSLPMNNTVNLRAACLGIVARNIIMSTSTPDSLTIHGVMLAGGRNTSDGSFYAQDYSDRDTGTLSLVGGIIQKKRGPVGTFNSSTGQQTSGFNKNYKYDLRMAINPPPYFPTTGSYERLSWIRTSASSATQ